jgi:hypothetical protein
MGKPSMAAMRTRRDAATKRRRDALAGLARDKKRAKAVAKAFLRYKKEEAKLEKLKTHIQKIYKGTNRASYTKAEAKHIQAFLKGKSVRSTLHAANDKYQEARTKYYEMKELAKYEETHNKYEAAQKLNASAYLGGRR